MVKPGIWGSNREVSTDNFDLEHRMISTKEIYHCEVTGFKEEIIVIPTVGIELRISCRVRYWGTLIIPAGVCFWSSKTVSSAANSTYIISNRRTESVKLRSRLDDARSLSEVSSSFVSVVMGNKEKGRRVSDV